MHPILVATNGVNLTYVDIFRSLLRGSAPISILRTIVSCPSHGLGTIPTRECIRRESRVYKREVRAVQNMVEIVVIVVDLRGRKLAFIHNVL